MNPEKIGRYEVDSEVGRGGMATVFKAYDPHFERWVAVKVLPREFMHEPEFRARFAREAKTIAMLEHPAIVPVYDFGEDDGQPYLVMRYMPGGSLADRLQNGPLPIEETAEILQRIGAALERAHSENIIHRDLKPSNILFDQYGDAFLADFGIVRIASSTSQLTASGSLVGTPTYMSPEQVYGDKELDGRSDIYALGIILFQMLTGRTPYEADTPAKVMMKHVMDPVPVISQIRPDLPPTANDIIGKALAKERSDRFSSATDLTRAVKTLTGQTQPPDLATELAAIRSEIAPELDAITTPDVPAAKPETAVPPAPTPARLNAITEELPARSTPAIPVMPPPTYGDISQSQEPTARTVPLWIWAMLGGLLVLCVAAIGIGIFLANSGFFGGDATPTAVAVSATETATPAPTSTSAPDNPTPDSTATALAEGRLATATAIAAVTEATPIPPTATTGSGSSAAEATRAALIAIRATQEAETAVNQATATTAALLAPQFAPSFGPISGSLTHEPDDSLIESEFADISLADFYLTATFYNPFSISDGSWDYGIFFRQSSADNEMRLVIRSDGSWNLNDRVGDEDNFINEGNISSFINKSVNAANTISLLIRGEHGFFFMNNTFVDVLDLSSRVTAGDLAVATGFYVGSEVAGAATDYDNFSVWELEPSFGPSSGVLEHIDDNLIKTRGASVDLRNVLADAYFVTPYDEAEGSWDMGFAFRDEDVGEQFWLVIESTGYWALYDRVNSDDDLIVDGEVPASALGLAAGDVNRVTLLALNDQGVFLLNDALVTTLDLSSRLNTGDVQVFTAYFVGNEIPGNETGYEDFSVWPLP